MAAGLVDAAYRIHPGVAEAGREEAGSELRDSVDTEMADLWKGVFWEAVEKEAKAWEAWFCGPGGAPCLT